MDYTSGRPAVFFFFDIQFIRDPSTQTVPSHVLNNASMSFIKKAEDQRRQAVCRKNQHAIGDCRDLRIWLELRVGEILLCSKEYSSMQAEGDTELRKLACFWNLDPRNTECRKGHSET